MAITYQQAILWFKQSKINDILASEGGLRFLKLRSMSRKANLMKVFQAINLEITNGGRQDYLKIAFNSDITEVQIDDVIKEIYISDREMRRSQEEDLINELYKLQTFDWGGLYQNNIDKNIVDNYVKKIKSYDILESKIDGELLTSLHGYVKCSWYNHWTSIIIEDIFTDNERIIPAVGKVKQIDFFYENTPMDLKVTHLPQEYIKNKRKLAELRKELYVLKKCAKDNGETIPNEKNETKQIELLWRKLSDNPTNEVQNTLLQIKEFRDNLVNEIIRDPTELIRWLYENQGTTRFDASNRLFLILINKSDYFNSWKLKRAKTLLQMGINEFLLREVGNLQNVSFLWGTSTYNVKTGAIILVQD